MKKFKLVQSGYETAWTAAGSPWTIIKAKTKAEAVAEFRRRNPDLYWYEVVVQFCGY